MTINILTANQSNVETDLTGFFIANKTLSGQGPTTGANVTVSRDTTTSFQGTASLKFVSDGTAAFQWVQASLSAAYSFQANQTYTFSAYLKASTGTPTVRFYCQTDGGSLGTVGSVTLSTTWTRYSFSVTMPASITQQYIALRMDTGTPAQAITVWMDELQIEQGSSVSAWVAGTGTLPTWMTLTVNNAASTTLSSALQLVNLISGGSTHGSTTVGTATGYGELYGAGTTNPWPSASGLGSPSGNGFLWDVTSLEGQAIVAGNWLTKLKLDVATAGVTADVYVRYYIYNSGTYTAIGQAVFSALSLGTSFTSYVATNVALSYTQFGTGDKFYVDVWANVTTNTSGSSANTISIADYGGSSGGGINTEFASPGYVSYATRTVTTSAALLSTFTRQVSASAALVTSVNVFTPNQSNVETDIYGFFVGGNTTTGQGPFTGGNVTISRDTTQHFEGAASLKVVTAGAQSFEALEIRRAPIAYTPNQSWTFSAYLMASTGTPTLRFYCQTDNGNIGTVGNVTLSTSWTRYSFTVTLPSTILPYDYIALRVDTGGTAQAITFWVDAAQAEQAPNATTFKTGTGATTAVPGAFFSQWRSVTPASAVLQGTQTRQVTPVSSALLATLARQVAPTSSALKATNTRQVTATADLFGPTTSTRTVPSSAAFVYATPRTTALYLKSVQSPNLATADSVYDFGGSTGTHAAVATVGTQTGWFEMTNPEQGAFTPTLAAGGPGPGAIPSGKGYLYSATRYEGSYFDAGGQWSATVRMATNDASTLTVDATMNVFVWHGASTSAAPKFSFVGSLTASNCAVTSTWTTFTTTTTALPGVGFFPGDRLYFEWWMNVKSSSGSTGTTQLQQGDISTTGGGAGGAQINTPNYQAMAQTAMNPSNPDFITQVGTSFQRQGQPFRYVGFDSYDLVVGGWTPAQQLARCQQLQQLGVTVVRTWCYGETTSATPVANYFQYGANGGQWNESAFVALDNAIAAAGQCGIKLILTLANQWSGYHGYKGTYVQYYNNANSTSLTDDNFHDTTGIIVLYQNYLKQLLTRVNTVTGVAYNRDPAILGWECINEGRYTTISEVNWATLSSNRLVQMAAWYNLAGSYIQALDGSHLVGTGGISQAYDWVSGDPFHNGTYYGLDLLTQSQLPCIDWVDYHMYPVSGSEPGPGNFLWPSSTSYHNMISTIGGYSATANKPVTMGEVGDNRLVTDNTQYSYLFPRDRYYGDLFVEAFNTNGFDGLLLWNYGADDYFGYATPDPAPTGTLWQNVADDPVFNLVILWNYLLNSPSGVTVGMVTQACDSAAAYLARRTASWLTPAPDILKQRTAGRLAGSGVAATVAGPERQALYNTDGQFDATNPATRYVTLLDQFGALCATLDTLTGGLKAYLQANGLTVSPYFLDAFNRYIAKQGSGTPLLNWQAFGPDGVALGVCNGGAYTELGTMPVAYGNAPLALVVGGAPTTSVASVTYTIIYRAYSASGALATNASPSVATNANLPELGAATIPAGAPVGSVFPLGVSGVEVTSIFATSGTPGASDQIACVSLPTRTLPF